MFRNIYGYRPADIRQIARNVGRKYPEAAERLMQEAEDLIPTMSLRYVLEAKTKRRLAKKAEVQGPPQPKRQKTAPATPTQVPALVASPCRTPTLRLQAAPPQVFNAEGARLEQMLFATQPRMLQPAVGPMPSAVGMDGAPLLIHWQPTRQKPAPAAPKCQPATRKGDQLEQVQLEQLLQTSQSDDHVNPEPLPSDDVVKEIEQPDVSALALHQADVPAVPTTATEELALDEEQGEPLNTDTSQFAEPLGELEDDQALFVFLGELEVDQALLGEHDEEQGEAINTDTSQSDHDDHSNTDTWLV
jgi:hypothetical protein